MPVYDSTFILNPQLEEGGLDDHIKRAVDLVNANNGKMVRENRLGMRRLAYEIQDVTQGYYVSLVFEGGKDTVSALEQMLRMDESCLRFLTCHYQDFSRKKERKETKSDDSKKAEKPAEASPAGRDKPENKPEEKPAESPAPAESESKAGESGQSEDDR